MKLIIDLGNTAKKLGIFQEDRLIHLEISDQVSLRMLKEIFEKFPDIEAGIVSSVVSFPAYLRSYLDEKVPGFIELNNHTPIPIINKYKTPGRLGKDRLACAVAGARLFNGFPVLVVNAGTCITYDFVTADREYLGGAISPGLQMRLKALHTFTEKLPLVPLKENSPLIGTDTQSSIMSGVVNGAIEEIKGVIRMYNKEHPTLQAVLSGGDGDYLDKLLKIRIFAFPNVVLFGLNEILDFNLKNAL